MVAVANTEFIRIGTGTSGPDAFSNAKIANGATAGFGQEDSYGMTVALHEMVHAIS